MLLRRWVLLLACFAVGCEIGQGVNNNPPLRSVYPVVDGRAKVDMVVLAESLERGKNLWAAEVERHYPGAVGVLCHGQDVDGKWTLFPDHLDIDFSMFPEIVTRVVQDKPIPVAEEVATLKAAYPGRLIVLVVCNPHHHRLNVTGVVYALDSVYVVPDRIRLVSDPEAVGNIFEFVSD